MIENTEGDQQDLPIYESLKRDIKNLKQLSSEACIFKVHEGLRRTNTDAYTPLLISIGPYHHGNAKLSKMENLKLMYLDLFLKREKQPSMEQCWEKLKDSKEKAASYYGDDEDIQLLLDSAGDKFVKMLLLDGCFIAEFLYREYDEETKKEEEEELNKKKCDNNAVFMPTGMKFQVFRDLLLLENQLPFFVLQELHGMVYDESKPKFLDIVKITFASMLTKVRLIPPIVPNLGDNNATEMKGHLLQIVHNLCNPQNGGIQEERHYWTLCFPCSLGKQSQDSKVGSSDIRTATELQEAGVNLKKVVKSSSLFHIKFNHAELEIPKFHITDPTETFFRNMIAYEQHSCDKNNMYFTDYAQLMDNLINTEKDVNLFRMNGVLVNWLGDDKEVTDLFNRLCKGVVYSSCDGFYYSDVCNKLNGHYNKPWNVMMAKLRHDYFNTPWAGISTIAAVFLLSLTIAQTVIAVLDLRK
ncbi:PREDICTED: UPF0481 protein At3g47200-like [Ipomoea nil]|uniref:UPF0481 protein At3g47200-like n=1 Tax=Ipomoea nil TaxID=35883 RepID=UPI000901C4BE|nr:PREDICTED: UPF0481 protein At3g47200-like [Ipomoea nil]XP_019193011.1 PREDICTED: UPF0481 protein At3g47200-like [Ipomoea nil]